MTPFLDANSQRAHKARNTLHSALLVGGLGPADRIFRLADLGRDGRGGHAGGDRRHLRVRAAPAAGGADGHVSRTPARPAQRRLDPAHRRCARRPRGASGAAQRLCDPQHDAQCLRHRHAPEGGDRHHGRAAAPPHAQRARGRAGARDQPHPQQRPGRHEPRRRDDALHPDAVLSRAVPGAVQSSSLSSGRLGDFLHRPSPALSRTDRRQPDPARRCRARASTTPTSRAPVSPAIPSPLPRPWRNWSAIRGTSGRT